MRYKNVSAQDLTVMNVGIVKAGGTLESDVVIENPNLVLQTDSVPESKSETAAEVTNQAEEPAKKIK